MIAPATTLFLDGFLCTSYGLIFMLYPEVMTNLHLNVPHTLGMTLMNQLFGSMLFGLGLGLSWIIDTNNKKMIGNAIDMRAVMWLLNLVFIMKNKGIFDYDMYLFTLGLNMIMTVLTLAHSSPFKIKPKIVSTGRTRKRGVKRTIRSITPEPVNPNKIMIKRRKVKEC